MVINQHATDRFAVLLSLSRSRPFLGYRPHAPTRERRHEGNHMPDLFEATHKQMILQKELPLDSMT